MSCDCAEDENILKLQQSLQFQLSEMEDCHSSLGQNFHSLQRELSALEASQLAVAKQLKPFFEKMMVLKMSTEAMMKVGLVLVINS